MTLSSDGKTVFAAVAKKDNTGDTFVQEDLSTFKQENYLTPDQNLRARDLFFLGNTLYFINTSDGKLYTISKSR